MIKVCVKCGSTNRGKNGACKDCAKEYRKLTSDYRKQYADKYNKEYLEKNRDRINQYKSDRYIENKSELQAKSREYYDKNKQDRIDYATIYRVENKSKVEDSQRKYRDANRERRNAYHSEYRKINREKMINYVVKRSRIVKEGTITVGLFTLLLREQGGNCPGCLNPLQSNTHMDHYLPLKLGGKHEDSNIQLLCAACNLKKNAKHPERWLEEITHH